MVNMLHKKLILSTAALALTIPHDTSAQELVLKSISSLDTFKLASICFLPDCGDKGIDIDINIPSKICKKKGYKYYSSGKCPDKEKETGRCMQDQNYLTCSAEAWCKDGGYTKTSCNSNQYLDNQCPNGLKLYKSCKCNLQFKHYTGNCSGNNSPTGASCINEGTGDNNTYFDQCICTPNTKPQGYDYSCTGEIKADGCGRNYRRCCSDTCSRGSTSYSGSFASTTECGTKCYYCKNCTSGSTSYSGSYVGSSECGSCYKCSSSCGSHSSEPISCPTNYYSTVMSYSECGGACYGCQYNSDCSVSSITCGSNTNGCNYNSCNKCISCIPKPCPTGYYQTGDWTYRHDGNLAVINNAKNGFCFPDSGYKYDAELSAIPRQQESVFLIYQDYTFTKNPFINEVNLDSKIDRTFNGNMSVGNIYAFSGNKITFNGHVHVLGKLYIGTGSKITFNGGVTFRGIELSITPPGGLCVTGWGGMRDDYGSGSCRTSGNSYY